MVPPSDGVGWAVGGGGEGGWFVRCAACAVASAAVPTEDGAWQGSRQAVLFCCLPACATRVGVYRWFLCCSCWPHGVPPCRLREASPGFVPRAIPRTRAARTTELVGWPLSGPRPCAWKRSGWRSLGRRRAGRRVGVKGAPPRALSSAPPAPSTHNPTRASHRGQAPPPVPPAAVLPPRVGGRGLEGLHDRRRPAGSCCGSTGCACIICPGPPPWPSDRRGRLRCGWGSLPPWGGQRLLSQRCSG